MPHSGYFLMLIEHLEPKKLATNMLDGEKKKEICAGEGGKASERAEKTHSLSPRNHPANPNLSN